MVTLHAIRVFAACGLGLVGLTLAACSSTAPELVAPQITIAPYESETGEVLWAVAPLRNESGTSAVDALAVSDKVVAASQEIRGVRCLPMNRVLETMRALKMTGVSTPGEIGRLAQHLGVDGVVVGSITAYDPYTPTMGLSLVLWARPGSAIEGPAAPAGMDALTLQAQVREQAPGRGRRLDGIVSSVSEHLDGKNHQVLMDVRSYAAGRSRQVDALQWRTYIVSMPHFEEFAASFTLGRLMDTEWIRLGRQAAAQGSEKNAQVVGNQTRRASLDPVVRGLPEGE